MRRQMVVWEEMFSMMERVISTGSFSKGSIASVSIAAAVSEGCMCRMKIQKESVSLNKCEAC